MLTLKDNILRETKENELFLQGDSNRLKAGFFIRKFV
jgi:hypothetical protein